MGIESSKNPRIVEREQGDINTTANREKYWERNLSEEAREIFEMDKKYFLHQALSTPVLNVLSRAEGIYIEDLDGKKYIDMHGNGVHNAGFSNPEVIEAVKKQLDDGLSFCPRRYTNLPAVQLAKKLSEISPGNLNKSLFCPGGSEAIEMAVALAIQTTGNFKTISFWDSFHGAGMASASIGGEAHFKGGMGPMMTGACHVEFPNYYRNPWNFKNQEAVDAECLRQIEMVFKKETSVAAIIGEPISATPVVPSKQFWEGVAELCQKYGALLIFDEIIEGFGVLEKCLPLSILSPLISWSSVSQWGVGWSLLLVWLPKKNMIAVRIDRSATTPMKKMHCALLLLWQKLHILSEKNWLKMPLFKVNMP